MDAIGGYFELELNSGKHYHENALKLNTARNAFEYVLRVRKYKKVYIPYYTCEVMLQPLVKLGISYEFYHVSLDLEPEYLPILKDNEAFLYTNYFGLKQKCILKLVDIYRSQLIVDNSQAFFAPHISGIDTFYSARKFFGVADGAYLYIDKLLDEDLLQDKSYSRMYHLLQRIDEGAEFAYNEFRKNDDALDNQPIRLMSKLTEKILSGINYCDVQKRRVYNFSFIDHYLKDENHLGVMSISKSVPMVYPFWGKNTKLRQALINSSVFVAQYWPNIKTWCSRTDIEYSLYEHIIPIPIDQRYSLEDMKRMIRIIQDNY